MPTINPSGLRAAPNDPMPWHGSAEPASQPGRDAAGFASLLQQQQHRTMPAPPPPPAPPPIASAPASASARSSAPAPAPPADATTPHDDAGAPSDEPSAAPLSSDAASRQRALLRSHARGTVEAPHRAAQATDGATPAESASPTAELGVTESEAAAAPNDSAASPPNVDPGVLQWLAAQQRSAAGTLRAPQGDSADNGRTAEPETATSATASSPPPAALDPGDPAGRAHPPKGSATDTGASPTAAFAAVLTEQLGAGNRTAEPGARSPVHGIDASGPTVFAPTPDNLVATPAPTAVEIASPLAGPQFAQELGLRMSVLASGGVQHAELHLNPAEMGPVSVQITIDGTQARIDFGADLAATRLAIEAGLPELASALRDEIGRAHV